MIPKANGQYVITNSNELVARSLHCTLDVIPKANKQSVFTDSIGLIARFISIHIGWDIKSK